jgi:hypothetical protein
MSAPLIREVVTAWHWLRHVERLDRPDLVAEAAAELEALCERFRMAQRVNRLFRGVS